jgi:hypothetical protein
MILTPVAIKSDDRDFLELFKFFKKSGKLEENQELIDFFV